MYLLCTLCPRRHHREHPLHVGGCAVAGAEVWGDGDEDFSADEGVVQGSAEVAAAFALLRSQVEAQYCPLTVPQSL